MTSSALTGARLDIVAEYDGEARIIPATTGEPEIDAAEQTVTFDILVTEDLEGLQAAKLVDDNGELQPYARYSRLPIRVYEGVDADEPHKTIEFRDVAVELKPITLPWDDVVVAHVICRARDGIHFINEDET